MPRDSAKNRIKAFFLANVGQVVTAAQLQEVASPVSEWARRVRELRENEAWPIRTNNDSAALKPGQYVLEDLPPERPNVSFSKGISQRLRAEVLDRNGFTCQMCGATPGEVDPVTGRKVRLHIGHIVDRSLGGQDVASNLRALCSSCNQGAKNLTAEKPTTVWLLAQVRRSGMEEQRAVFEWLTRKFHP
jgi:5-methylcytosine-specific restriction endonuclease McrA